MTLHELPFYPERVPKSSVLRSHSEVKKVLEILTSYGMPLHSDLPKNWDSLAALSVMVELLSMRSDLTILDAGGELYSTILIKLKKFGLRNLMSMNLAFPKEFVQGGVRHIPGDITNMNLENNCLDGVTCLSVIEHGVDLKSFFQEMSRVLKPAGVLIVSFDYWQLPIDTHDYVAYGSPIKVFTSDEVIAMTELAHSFGLVLIEPLHLECEEKVVTWSAFDLQYTFAYFTLRKICV